MFGGKFRDLGEEGPGGRRELCVGARPGCCSPGGLTRTRSADQILKEGMMSLGGFRMKLWALFYFRGVRTRIALKHYDVDTRLKEGEQIEVGAGHMTKPLGAAVTGKPEEFSADEPKKLYPDA